MFGKGGSDVPCLMELKAAEAARRLTTDGPNELPSGDHCGGLRIVTDVLRSYGPRPDLLAVSQVWQGEVRQTACLVATKRAPEAAAALCRLSPQDHDSMAQAANAMAKSGLRVLAIACGTAADRLPQTQHDLTLTFLGLVGLADPFRESVHIWIAMGAAGPILRARLRPSCFWMMISDRLCARCGWGGGSMTTCARRSALSLPSTCRPPVWPFCR